MNEAVDRLIAERERLDAGLPATVLVSIVAHLTLIAVAITLPMILPRKPPLEVIPGFAVVLPRGGGGSPAAAPPAAAPAPRPAPPVTAPPAPPPRVIKPPAKEAVHPNALPSLDSRRTAKRPQPAASASTASAGAAKAGSATPGLEFGPAGPGVPNGTDSGGDWYLAGVQQKIWMQWSQQIKAGFSQPIGVTFTIMPDGSVTNVRVTQPSGVSLLDMAAQRAVLNAGPFGPLPRENGQSPRTIQALFKPTT